jgi:hypothetical protein
VLFLLFFTVSLAEIDRFICKQYPVYNDKHYKPALVRAYKFADKDGSGLISSNEFRTLLRSLSFFQNLWNKFQAIDVDNDHSISIEEFVHQREQLGIKLNKKDAEELFQKIDTDGSGKLRFYELASHCAQELALEEERHSKATSSPEDDSALLASRTRRDGRSTDVDVAMTHPKQRGPDRQKHMSHDGLLITAPRGTEFEDEWLDIVEGLEDLEHQSAEAMHGLRESCDGGKGGRLISDGRRLINRRRCDDVDVFPVVMMLLCFH